MLSDAYAAQAKVAETRGWPVRRLDGHHLWPLVEPDRVAAAVIDVIPAL